LQQNYPNPFNPETTIRYDLPVQAEVRLTIFDVLGRTVRTLIEQKQPAGGHSAVWDGRDDRGRQLASGLYLYRVTAGEFHKTAKMLLLK
jgi:flagellar hook assembly protein FlgD